MLGVLLSQLQQESITVWAGRPLYCRTPLWVVVSGCLARGLQLTWPAALPPNISCRSHFQSVFLRTTVKHCLVVLLLVVLLLPQMYDMLLASGATVIAVPPWPNRFVTRDSDNERQRQLLRNMMTEYVASTANRQRQPRVHLLELPAEWFDFWSMPASRVSQMQDDLLHLTPYGYDMFGQLVADKILSLVSPTECLCPCANGSSGGSSGSSGGKAQQPSLLQHQQQPQQNQQVMSVVVGFKDGSCGFSLGKLEEMLQGAAAEASAAEKLRLANQQLQVCAGSRGRRERGLCAAGVPSRSRLAGLGVPLTPFPCIATAVWSRTLKQRLLKVMLSTDSQQSGLWCRGVAPADACDVTWPLAPFPCT